MDGDGEDDASIVETNAATEAVAAPALIAVHPLDRSVAVAVGSELRVFDLQGDQPIDLVDHSSGPAHSDAIKVISFGAEGRLFVSAGDDKLVKIWATDVWRCLRTVHAEKRVCAAAITHDGMFVAFADKFGVVWIIGLDGCSDGQSSIEEKPIPILGHYCSIITSLKFSPDGCFLASADRDFKIRITVFPKKPLEGAHEIQSYCLGHTNFVSCLAFLCPPDSSSGFLLSGSGDATVRLWDHISGCLLHTCEVGAKAGLLGSNGAHNESFPVVTDICTSAEDSVFAAAIQNLHGVVLMHCDYSSKAIFIDKIVHMEDGYVPTSLGMSSASRRIWSVRGGSDPTSSCSGGGPTLVGMRVISVAPKNIEEGIPGEQGPAVLENAQVPGGEKLLMKLQGSLSVEEAAETLAAATEAVKATLRSLFTKKQYPHEKREHRKRDRNDRKLK